MGENFPNLGKVVDIQIQKTQKIPTRMNPNKSTTKHTISKLSKVKDKEF